MAARNTARKRAFQILFEGDQRGADVLTVLADWVRLSRADTRQPPVSEYTMELVEGYASHAKRIDELIAQYSVGWTLDRMPVVDRNILRLGAYELIRSGRARVHVDSVFPLADTRAAHERMEAGEQLGKIVLSIPG